MTAPSSPVPAVEAELSNFDLLNTVVRVAADLERGNLGDLCAAVLTRMSTPTPGRAAEPDTMGEVEELLRAYNRASGNWERAPERLHDLPEKNRLGRIADRAGVALLDAYREVVAERDQATAAHENAYALWKRDNARLAIESRLVEELGAGLRAAEAQIVKLTTDLERLRSLPKVEFYQQDFIPGFAAFLPNATTPVPNSRAFCVLNIGSTLAGVHLGEVPTADLPYAIAETMMHEVIHVLEHWAGVEFSEERVETLLDKYRARFSQSEL